MKLFSVVVPVAPQDGSMLKRTLPSWYALNPNEVLLCLDYPADSKLVETIWRVADACHTLSETRIIEVHRDSSYRFHQANVRRTGFREAKHDIILTGDIDLVVFPSCLEALQYVGEDDVGLVSLSKRRRKPSLVGKLRSFIENLARYHASTMSKKDAGKAYFTGLYWLYRPYWLDSESVEALKRLPNPKNPSALYFAGFGGYMGEDTFLRNCMIKKHNVLYLPSVGADDLNAGLEDTSVIQVKIGRKYAFDHNLANGVRHAVVHVRPYVLLGLWLQICEQESVTSAFGLVLNAFTNIVFRVSYKRAIAVLLKWAYGYDGRTRYFASHSHIWNFPYER